MKRRLYLAAVSCVALFTVYCTSGPDKGTGARVPNSTTGGEVLRTETRRHVVQDIGVLVVEVRDLMTNGRSRTLVDVRVECQHSAGQSFQIFPEPFEVFDIDLNRFERFGRSGVRITYTLAQETNTRLNAAGEIEYLPPPLLSQDYDLRVICDHFRNQ